MSSMLTVTLRSAGIATPGPFLRRRIFVRRLGFGWHRANLIGLLLLLCKHDTADAQDE
jgi:hypothetical protein